MRSLIDILDLSTDEIDELLAKANDIIARPDAYREKCRYKKLARCSSSRLPARG